jgi:hypothetical protein
MAEDPIPVDGCAPGVIVRTTEVDSPYDIDLRRPPSERWREVILKEGGTAQRLALAAQRELPWLARLLASPLGALFRIAYTVSGGLYRAEMSSWADAMDVPVGVATMLNCAYELSYLDPSYKTGCTAGAICLDSYGIVHLRNLDWSVAGLGGGTRLFRFHGANHCFVAVGTLGFVGVLSGMVPGQYSATINWAPPDRRLWPTAFGRFGAAFWLRHTLETCENARDAIDALTTQKLATGAFYTVCDAQQKQAVVVERVADGHVRRDGPRPLVHANHFVEEAYARVNQVIDKPQREGAQTELKCSEKRRAVLEVLLNGLPSTASLKEAAALLNIAPVLNVETCQQMLFAPLTGDVLARGVDVRKTGSETVASDVDVWTHVTMTNEGGRCEKCRA